MGSMYAFRRDFTVTPNGIVSFGKIMLIFSMMGGIHLEEISNTRLRYYCYEERDFQMARDIALDNNCAFSVSETDNVQ